MRSVIRKGWVAGLGLAFLAGLATSDVRAQTVTPGPGPGGSGWYSFVPGQGWVGYNPTSAPAVSPGTVASAAAPASNGTTPSAGWAGYAPATAWRGYAPASAVYNPALAATTPAQATLPFDGSRRRASGLFVNGDNPRYAYTLSSYKEYGSGRPVPLTKPWLPLSP